MEKIVSLELISHVVIGDSTHVAAAMSCLNKHIRSAINFGVWLDIATRITGYDARKHAKDMNDVKLLICPWLSLPKIRDLNPGWLPLLATTSIAFEGEDRMLMSIRKDGEEEEVYEFPCYGDGRLVRVHNKTVPPHEAMELTGIPEIFSTEIPHRRLHDWYPVHNGVYAHFELFRTSYASGIYFFTKKDNRMLRHMELPWQAFVITELSMCTRPKEMWVLIRDHIVAYTPNNGPAKLASPSERVDPALWHAYFKRPDEALKYLEDSNIHINQITYYSHHTTLHFAAMGGDVHTIRKLVEAKANIRVKSHYDDTALSLAAEYLQADAVRELLRLGAKANPNVYRQFGDKTQNLQAVIDTIDALPSRDPLFKMLLSNRAVKSYPSAFQHVIRKGVKTSTDNLHEFLMWPRQNNNDVESTVALFTDEQINTKINTWNALEIAVSRNLSANTIAHIRARTRKYPK